MAVALNEPNERTSLLPFPDSQRQELDAPMQDVESLVNPSQSPVAHKRRESSVQFSDDESPAFSRVGSFHRHHRRWKESSFAFKSTILDEILEDVDLESLAVDALFEFATAGELPLEPDELVAATVLIVEEERDWGDLRRSLLSNAFFICGGSLELLSALWDFRLNGLGDSTELWAKLHLAVGILGLAVVLITGPLVYLLNSIVDTMWAIKAERREERHDQLDMLKIDLVAPDQDAELVQLRRSASGQKSIRLRLPFEPRNIMRRLRRHIGNRRALSAAIAFGVGASSEFASAYFGEFAIMSNEMSFYIDALSANAYFASALFTLSGRDEGDREHKSWLYILNDAARLETFGDIFFAFAVTVDVAICYLSLDDIKWWPVISAALWQIDALCYLRADFVSLDTYNANQPLGDETTQSNDTSMSCNSNETAQLSGSSS